MSTDTVREQPPGRPVKGNKFAMFTTHLGNGHLHSRPMKTQNKAMLIQTLTMIGDGETAKFLAEKYNNLESSHKAEVLRDLSRLDLEKVNELAAQAWVASDSSDHGHTVQGLLAQAGEAAG